MIYGVLFTRGEIGQSIQCGICGRKASEGFFLETANEKEFRFLEMSFMGISNATVNSCCRSIFEKECDKQGFRFKMTNLPPDELLDAVSDIGKIPEHLSENISLEHEFYHVETNNGDKILGYLFDYNDMSFELQNCLKYNAASNKWDRAGDNEFAYYRIDIPTSAIKKIEKTPYVKKNDSFYGFKPFVDEKS